MLYIAFGERNSIERFYNDINAKVGKIGCLTVFLNLFVLFYNHIRWHQGVGGIP